MNRGELLADLIAWGAEYDEAFGERTEDGSYNDAEVDWDRVHHAEDQAVDLAHAVLAMLRDGRL